MTNRGVCILTTMVVLTGCGSAARGARDAVAVGTYVGGGDVIFGPDPCTYTAAPGVLGKSEYAPRGPLMVIGAGTITATCPNNNHEIDAVVPTAARISGPTKVAAGGAGDFDGTLVAGERIASGKARIEWTLGRDCDGAAHFDAVLGAQDTGGPDRNRKLLATAKGACTVSLSLTTGDSADASVPHQTFKAEQHVVIE